VEAGGKIRNPKAEIRRKPEIRRPKSERQRRESYRQE
jgi:hypothetical protein